MSSTGLALKLFGFHPYWLSVVRGGQCGISPSEIAVMGDSGHTTQNTCQ